ncbi:MAG: alpha/beta hydrolase [Actinobacteria bacterium]|nr:alpha/beta hydrolase [Actinomycetota bacterium]
MSILQDVEDATEKMIRDSNRFHYPVIVYCGAENSFQSVESVEKLFSEFSSKDKTFRCFPHGYHCLHLDDECQIIKEETLRWMQERSDRGKFAKLSAFRSVNISRSRVPWSKIIGLVLLLVAAVKMLRYLRVKFSKF